MFNEAKVDLNEVLRLEPNNKQAKHDMEIVIKKTKQVSSYFCRQYSNLLIKKINLECCKKKL